MPNLDLEAMDFDELWLMHERLTKILSEKITAEKLELEKRLAHLRRAEPTDDRHQSQVRGQRPSDAPRRKYPKVLPKYYNPAVPAQTWSGRGKMPRWLVAALNAGRTLEDFKIEDPEKYSVET